MEPHLVLKSAERSYSTVRVNAPAGPHDIGPGTFTIIAGPCAVEGRESYLEEARVLRDMGVHILRGGAFKPRTSPYSFAGLKEEGLAILKEARESTGLPVVTEVMDVRQLDRVLEVVDIIQIGSRNMHNFSLLIEVGRSHKPVLLKRGFASTLEEWLLAAEYIMNEGNDQIILCERGIRTFENSTRNTVDLGSVALLKELSHLPVIVDPSHATGNWRLVSPVARAACAVGSDGIMVEVHPHPDMALSDGRQSLTPEHFEGLLTQIKPLATLMKRDL